MKLLLVSVLSSNSRRKAFRLSTLALLWCAAIAAIIGARPVKSEVFYAQEEALKVAFPTATRVEPKTFVLTKEQVERVAKLAETSVESSLFTFYVGYHDDILLGYAAIDSHRVRTMPETFMTILSPEGIQERVVVLAFQEPPDYLASDRWLQQFKGKRLKDDLFPGRGIHGIVGSTLTAHAMSAGVRKVLALYQLLIKKE